MVHTTRSRAPFMRTVHCIPDELITHAFSFLTFRELLNAAQVSQLWRDLGIEHHNFWKYITITSAARGQLELLKARLGQSNGRPYQLEVDIEGRHPLIPKVLIDIIHRMFNTVEVLVIRLEAWYLKELWTILNSPAPKLEAFRVMLYSPDRLLPRIPIQPWIFSNRTDMLRLVKITDVLLLSSSSVPAFVNVETLSYILPRSGFMPWPTYLFDIFPNMRILYLEGGRITWENEKISEVDRRGLSQLAVLDFDFVPDTTAEFVRRMPIRTIPHVLLGCVDGLDFDAVYDLVEPLRSPFHLSLLSVFPKEFWIILTDVRTGNQRVFAEATSRWPAERDGAQDAPNVLLDNEYLPAQINSLRISVTIWRRVTPYLEKFTTVGTLVIELDQVHKRCHYALPNYRAFAFPLVHTLVLDARYEIEWITAEDLLDFADRVTPSCKHVELRRVMVEGRDRLGDRFESVELVDGRRWIHQSTFATRSHRR